MAISEVEQLESSTLLAQTGLLVAATDADGRLALLSPGMQELFDLPFEPLPECEFSDRFHLVTADGTASLPTEDIPVVRARRGEVVRDALVAARCPGGRLIYMRCNASPLVDPDGRVAGAIVLIQDVTAERAALERQADLRHRLLETVNHHLRTPVTNLVGYAEILDDHKNDLPVHSHRAVDAVHGAAKELASLLETVSALADLDRHAELTKTCGDLSAALGQVVRTLAPLFEQRQVRLHLDLPGPLPVTVDFAEVRRAVAELLRNAAIYASPHTQVVLRARRDGACAEVTISDQGPGIPTSDHARLVQPFERGSHQHQDVTGRGLGLAIANTIALAHGGTLLLQANHPAGLAAIVRLPDR